MVKSIQINFDDEDFERLVSAKGNLSWREFILRLVDTQNYNYKPESTQGKPINAFSGVSLTQEDIQ